MCIRERLFTVGCMKSPESARSIGTTNHPALHQPPSTQDAVHLPQVRDVQARAASLVIDVAPTAEIRGVVRSVFEDSRGTLWIGGECDLFRNDGRTLTNYEIRDEPGRAVTIKAIIADQTGPTWCGTTGGIPRIDDQSLKRFGETDG